MKIAIVDDLPDEIVRLRELIVQQFHQAHIAIHRLDTFSCAEDLLEAWQPEQYDLIILDIFMGRLSGVDAAHQLRQRDPEVKLVFCTTSNAFASESYAVGASYYLHKPYGEQDIRAMILKIRPRDYELTRYILLPDGQKLILRDILYTEYANHIIYIHRKRGTDTQVRMGQAALEALLTNDPYLVSCAKGLMVNLYEVDRQEGDTFILSDGSRIPISRRRAKEVQKIYNDFLFQKIRKEMLL